MNFSVFSKIKFKKVVKNKVLLNDKTCRFYLLQKLKKMGDMMKLHIS